MIVLLEHEKIFGTPIFRKKFDENEGRIDDLMLNFEKDQGIKHDNVDVKKFYRPLQAKIPIFNDINPSWPSTGLLHLTSGRTLLHIFNPECRNWKNKNEELLPFELGQLIILPTYLKWHLISDSTEEILFLVVGHKNNQIAPWLMINTRNNIGEFND